MIAGDNKDDNEKDDGDESMDDDNFYSKRKLNTGVVLMAEEDDFVNNNATKMVVKNNNSNGYCTTNSRRRDELNGTTKKTTGRCANDEISVMSNVNHCEDEDENEANGRATTKGNDEEEEEQLRLVKMKKRRGENGFNNDGEEEGGHSEKTTPPDFSFTFPNTKKEQHRSAMEEESSDESRMSSASLRRRPVVNEGEGSVERRRFVEWKSEMTPLNEARLAELFNGRSRTPSTSIKDLPPSTSSFGGVSTSNYHSSDSTSSKPKVSNMELAFKSKWTATKPPDESPTIGINGQRRPSALENVREQFMTPDGESTDDEEGDEEGRIVEKTSEECRAIWQRRYSLSKKPDDEISSAGEDLSDNGGGNDEQVFDEVDEDGESNASSQESDTEQCPTEETNVDGEKKKRRHKWKRHAGSIGSDVEEDEEEYVEDEDEGHVGDDASSLASSTSCSEDSFEIGTILTTDTNSTPSSTCCRSVDDYARTTTGTMSSLVSMSPMKSRRRNRMEQEEQQQQRSEKLACEEEVRPPTIDTKLVSCSASNWEIDQGRRAPEDNNGSPPLPSVENVRSEVTTTVLPSLEVNNIWNAVEIPMRDSSSSASSSNHLESSLLANGTASTAAMSPPPSEFTSCFPAAPTAAVASSSSGLFSSSTSGFSTSSTSKERQSIINEELSSLDTGLPQFDFEKLEKQLTDAAKEQEMNQRRLMSEHVLHRLTTDSSTDQPRYHHPPAATKRPMRSNLGARLQSGMNLQICFMNDAAPTDEDDEDEVGEWGDVVEDECSSKVPKSRSTPNLGEPSGSGRGVGRSVSSCGDSNKRASELRRAIIERHKSEEQDFTKRQARLEEEAKLMLVKAKQAAHMQMEMERQGKTAKVESGIIEKVIGVQNLGRRKLTRSQLTKMCITQLQIILNDLHTKIEALNDELVHLLMERDSLHMEQDSTLVDIEDLLQHQRCVDIPMPDFLVADPIIAPSSFVVNSGSNNNLNNNNNNKSTRFRIFKR